MSQMLEIENITKAYASKTAVNNLSLAIPRGCVFGLLGPNGAGKTTLIRMITCITRPDSGQIRFLNEPLRESHQQKIGYMPEERGLYKKMKIGEQISYLLQLKGLKEAEAEKQTDIWLERLELTKWKNNKVDELSKGMQQKAQFIVTVAHNPPLLILDEPFSGLDPINANLLQNIIVELRNAGTTIIFSTHRMEQVEEFCDRIALINNGKIVLEGEVADIRKQFRQNLFTIETDEDLSGFAFPPEMEVSNCTGNRAEIALKEGYASRQMIAYLNEHLHLTRFEQFVPPMREIFIQTVKNTAAEKTMAN